MYTHMCMHAQIHTHTHTHIHTHTHTYTHTNTSLIILANSIYSSMNNLEDFNEYFTKPTSIRNKSWYIRSAGLCKKWWLKLLVYGKTVQLKFLEDLVILGLLVLSAVSTYSMCRQCMHVILIKALFECASLLGPHFLHVKIQAYGYIHT